MVQQVQPTQTIKQPVKPVVKKPVVSKPAVTQPVKQPVQGQVQPVEEPSIWGKWWIWVIIAVIVIGVIGGLVWWLFL